MEHSQPEATIRRCLYRDLDQLLPIYNHYVSRTVLSLDLDPLSVSDMQRLYNSVLDSELPFLIVTVTNDQDPAHNREDILGYAYAQKFHGLNAFGGTAELFIYLDPDATGRGIGEKMLRLLMDMLRQGSDHHNGIREVLAIVPVDEGRDATGFFLKQQFEERGLLKGVGWKMGRWIDMRYLQRSLHDDSMDTEQRVQARRKSEKREAQRRVQVRLEPEKREPGRRWWSSLFRRRRRRTGQG